MPPPDYPAIGTGILAVASAVWAGLNHFRVDRQKERQEQVKAVDKAHQELNTAHQELMKTTVARIETIEKDKEAWKVRYDEAHKEFAEYRNKHHQQMNDAQGLVLKLTDENAQLKAKTDLTPVLRFQEEQSLINAEVLKGLRKLVEAMPDARRDAGGKP